jgi:hypothetical protein
MEPVGSLPCSQDSVTDRSPELDDSSNRQPPILSSKIHFDIILQSTPRSSVSSLPFGIYGRNFMIQAYAETNSTEDS